MQQPERMPVASHGAPQGALREGTPREIIGDVTSYLNVGVAGVVMPGRLFNTPLVRPSKSGQRTGHRSEVGDNLPSTSQEEVQLWPQPF